MQSDNPQNANAICKRQECRICPQLNPSSYTYTEFPVRPSIPLSTISKAQDRLSSLSHTHESTTASAPSSGGALLLHFLRNFDVDLEEFGDAAIKADRFALIEIGFAVVVWYTFLCACGHETGQGSGSVSICKR